MRSPGNNSQDSIRIPRQSRIAALILLVYGLLSMLHSLTSPGIGYSRGIAVLTSMGIATIFSLSWLIFQLWRRVGWYLLLIVGLLSLVLSFPTRGVIGILVFSVVLLLLLSDRPSKWTDMPRKWQLPGDFVDALKGRVHDHVRILIAFSPLIIIVCAGLVIGWQHLYVAGKAPDVSGQYRIFNWDAEYFWSHDSRAIYYIDTQSSNPAIVRYSLEDKTKRTVNFDYSGHLGDQAKAALSPNGKTAVLAGVDHVALIELSSGATKTLHKGWDEFHTPFWISDHSIGLLGNGFAVYDLDKHTLTWRSKNSVNYNMRVAEDGSGFVDYSDKIVYFETKTGRKISSWVDKNHELDKCNWALYVTNRYFVCQQYYDNNNLCVVDIQNRNRPPLIIKGCPEMHSLSPDLKWYARPEGGIGEWTDHALFVGKTPSWVRNKILGYVR